MNTRIHAPHAFASDNNAPIHPDVFAAMARANVGHAAAYGDDDWTRRAQRLAAREFGRGARVFATLNGTGANVVALAALLAPHEAVICAESAHIHTDECGAPERVAGAKLLTRPSADGKLTPRAIEAHLVGLGFEHHIQPRVVSITQSTELGTVYSLAELRELARFCKKRGLLLHMDGARLCNAAAALKSSLRELTRGVDILSFGLTKNGAMNVDVVVAASAATPLPLSFIRKQTGQLGSKLRYVSAQFCAMFENELWRKNASHANAMAKLLEREARVIPGVEIAFPVQANVVFARLPKKSIAPLRRRVRFYDWDEREGLVRWVCSWDTRREDVLAFASALRAVLRPSSRTEMRKTRAAPRP